MGTPNCMTDYEMMQKKKQTKKSKAGKGVLRSLTVTNKQTWEEKVKESGESITLVNEICVHQIIYI